MLKKTEIKLIFLLCICFQFSWSQTIEIQGKIESTNDLENIHIINKTLQKFTITNANGEFNIPAKVTDTLIVSSVQNKLKVLVITIENILSKKITIVLEEYINELDEVVLGKMLTGDLMKDMSSVVGKPITAKSLGIPSYQGPLKTQNERILQEASDFNPTAGGSLGGAGGSIGIIPLINAISGRTKKLKNIVKLERKEALMYNVKTKFSKDLFEENPLPKDNIMDFFYFVSDDESFTKICNNKSDLEILVFLKIKLKAYKANLKLHEN